jgi:hypothetical protein
MEAHLNEMKGRLDGTWDTLDGAQMKLEQAKEDVRKTVLDFPLAYRGLIQEKKHVFDNLKYQGIEKKAAEVFHDHARDEEETKQRRKQHKQSDASHLPSYPHNPHRPVVISTSSSLGIEVLIHPQTSIIDGMGWDKQFAEFRA